MDRITKQIAGFASALRFEHLSEETVHAATQRLIDSLGCGLGAHDCEPAQIGLRLSRGQTPGETAGRVLFYGDVLPLEASSFINTAMIRNFDFNDRYPGGHPSDALGPLLSLASAERTDGKRLLTAMTVIYEIFGRLADSAQLSRRGWDQGFGITLSAAAGLCNYLGLPMDVTANAVGIAATSAVPLRVTRSGELTSWKNVATAYASRNGAFAALLAAAGQEGPGNAFEGRHGLFDNVTGPFELTPFPTEDGPSLVPRVQIKYWPVETNGQPVIWAALKLRETVKPDDIQEVEVFANKFTWFEIGSEPQKWDPQTRETADHSLPYMFARALIDGPVTTRSFTAEKARDPLLRPLMQKVKVTVDDALEAALPRMILRVNVKTSDGQQHDVEIVDPLGHPDNPMRDRDIDAKFSAMAEPIIGGERTKRALDALWRVDESADVGGLMAMLDLKPR
jgi:2-methylcitrate dehydratase